MYKHWRKESGISALSGKACCATGPVTSRRARVPDGAAACKFFADAGRERPENYEKDVQLPLE